jgi:predicted alpha/beta hydrolase
MPVETLTVPARDGYPLAADLHLPDGAPVAAALVAPAMGVPRRYYAAFASYLARAGIAALAVDVRGVGGSRPARLRGFEATLAGWGEHDLAGALDALAGRFPRVKLLWVGHSAGGQLFGLVDGPPVSGALLVASQSGHWRHWDGLWRVVMAGMWWAVVPALASTVGYLPLRALGQGEDVPKGVALEWARWGRHPEYILPHARARGGAAFARYDGPLRAYAIADDAYAPAAAVRALVAGYSAARAEVRVVRPEDVGERRIGHFGFFRPHFEATLWGDALAWLRGAAGIAPDALRARA